VDSDVEQIKNAIQKIKLYPMHNEKHPYGDGNVGKKILETMCSILLDRDKLLCKKITF
jgi:UDP-N-acetylglucosamine 2-epimerase